MTTMTRLPFTTLAYKVSLNSLLHVFLATGIHRGPVVVMELSVCFLSALVCFDVDAPLCFTHGAFTE